MEMSDCMQVSGCVSIYVFYSSEFLCHMSMCMSENIIAMVPKKTLLMCMSNLTFLITWVLILDD